MKEKNITVIGLGYVGLSIAVLLSQNNKIIAADIDVEKINKLNSKISPIKDFEIQDFLMNKKLNLTAQLLEDVQYSETDYIIICTPTNYYEEINNFDTASIDNLLKELADKDVEATIIIKSTIPIGYMKKIAQRHPNLSLLFAPEFLREGKALYDNLYPSRIIIGTLLSDEYLIKKANEFAVLLKESALKEDIPILCVDYMEAESIKLFANTFLALRISYFNELDTFDETNGLNAKNIIEGICYDSRIGDYYNNPSFGYGGYCLPKDTKQLLSNYQGIPQNLIEATIISNKTRKEFVIDSIVTMIDNLLKEDPIIGIYRLTMKKDSDNYRESSIFTIIEQLKNKYKIIIYEPMINNELFNEFEIVNELKDFKLKSDLIIANRIDDNLVDSLDKVYSRDIYYRD